MKIRIMGAFNEMKPLKGYRNVTDEVMRPKCRTPACPRDSVIRVDERWLCRECAIMYVRMKKMEEKDGNVHDVNEG